MNTTQDKNELNETKEIEYDHMNLVMMRNTTLFFK